VSLATSVAVAQIPPPADAPKPRSPEASAAAFKLPDGFRMEVVANEPLIASPSAVCWDERGRIFVSELHGYNLEGQLDIEELNKTGKLDTQVRRVQADEKFKKAAEKGTFGVVKLLHDTDGDGRMDKADVWTTNLPPAYGLVPARGGVIVACAPDIVFLADRDGDGSAETRETLFTGFRVGMLERGINAPQWGADGWIYFGRGWGGGKITGPGLAQPVTLPGSDFRIRADGSAIEPVTGSTHTFGFAVTESGDRFVVTTTTPGIFIAPLPWRYLARNPDAATPPIEAATGDRRAYSISRPHPWRQKRADDPAYFKYYRDRYGAAESEADGWFTAACSPLIYQDQTLPGLHGQYFVCEPAGNLIHRALIEPAGAGLQLRRAPGEEKSEFAASADAWSHPMNLAHGPDGCIWVVDYYREIIEDYSAIPRHLQQQYGLYAGHDRGRIYRLTHRDALRAPASDMSRLDGSALARELSSPSFWRRQTAQRLLVERGQKSAAAALREVLTGNSGKAATVIAALWTLGGLGALTPSDVRPFLSHGEVAVRIHALQLADRWFAQDAGRDVLATALDAAASEQNPRVLIQFALSLGESRDARAFALLARFARENLALRWMDAAILSSLHRRGPEMLAELIREPGAAEPFLSPLAQSIGAGRDETELARALTLVATANPETQTAVLGGLIKGRKNAPRKPLGSVAARKALASFAANGMATVRAAARALEDTFVASADDEKELLPAGATPPAMEVSEETFRKYVAALAGQRDAKRGQDVFRQACAVCHRVGDEGHHFGPDLLGELGVAEETLVRHILLPNERIRPGYETTLVELQTGPPVTGLLKDDGATSLTVLLPGGGEQVLLRKDVTGVRRLPSSLMPSFGEAFTPADLASLLAWLRGNLRAPAQPAR
jgi:putative membrane-bound dehydrogenase-like protein